MSNRLVFATRFKIRLEAIAEYIFKSSKSKSITQSHISGIKNSLQVLKVHPLLGREAKEFGEGIRKIVVLEYSVLYAYNERSSQIEILNIFRENLP